MKLLNIRLSAATIKRYHTAIIVGEQTVGEHTYGVAQIMRHITEDVWSRNLMCACLDHDIMEYFVGDVPHPSKKMFPHLHDLIRVLEDSLHVEHSTDYHLTDREMVILRAADLFEAGYFGLHQMSLGNRHGADIVKAILTALSAIEEHLPEEGRELFTELEKMYENGSK